jgi:hypothetical protein
MDKKAQNLMLIFDFVEKGFKKFMQKVIKKAMEKKSF